MQPLRVRLCDQLESRFALRTEMTLSSTGAPVRPCLAPWTQAGRPHGGQYLVIEAFFQLLFPHRGGKSRPGHENYRIHVGW